MENTAPSMSSASSSTPSSLRQRLIIDNTSSGGVLQQKLLSLEKKLRDLNILDVSKNERQSATPNGCKTSPLPRRQFPTMSLSMANNVTGAGTGVKHRNHDWINVMGTPNSPNRHSDSAETQRRMDDIMQQTGVLKLRSKEYKTQPDDLQFLCDLGHGTCGHVVKMKHKDTGIEMAVKQMRRSGNKEENKQIIMDLEVVLRSNECPYIVRCLGCFVTDSEVWICMELMATCLDKLIRRTQKGIPEEVLGKMAVSVVRALNYLKAKQRIIHRDVKPSNMLVDWEGNIKLCDFGISGRLVDSKAKTQTAGCAAYMAPERIQPPDPTNVNYDIRADVWSLGISLVELATGRFPYGTCETHFEMLTKILLTDSPVLTPKDGFSPMFCSFLERCLVKDCNKRPKYPELMEHEFLKYHETSNVDVGTWFRKTMAEIPPSPQSQYSPFAEIN